MALFLEGEFNFKVKLHI